MLPTIIVVVSLGISALIPSQTLYYRSSEELKPSMAITTLEERIALKSEEYGVDKNKVVAIMQCESEMNPNALNTNTNGTKDYSFWQINSVHMKRASELGLDIKNPEDNLEYGFILFSTEGDWPWNSSRKCWTS